jgi:hypothetical protein
VLEQAEVLSAAWGTEPPSEPPILEYPVAAEHATDLLAVAERPPAD